MVGNTTSTESNVINREFSILPLTQAKFDGANGCPQSFLYCNLLRLSVA